MTATVTTTDRAATGGPLLSVERLSVRYEPKRHAPTEAVSDVSFEIRPGEFIGLIGESGSGKTTLGTALLRLLERPAGSAPDGSSSTAPTSPTSPRTTCVGCGGPRSPPSSSRA